MKKNKQMKMSVAESVLGLTSKNISATDLDNLASESKNPNEFLSKLQNEYLKKSGFTQEEIDTGRINIFEHVDDPIPENKITLATTMRLLDVVPIIEQALCDKYISCLKEKDIFRQQIKLRLNKVAKDLLTINNEVYRNIDKSGEKSAASQNTWYDNSNDFAAKFMEAMVAYVNRIETMTNISGYLNKQKQEDILISEATMLCKLKPGDIFVFLDVETYCEYQFEGLDFIDDTKGYIARFKKISGDIKMWDDKPFRPVVNVSLFDNEEIIKRFSNESK